MSTALLGVKASPMHIQHAAASAKADFYLVRPSVRCCSLDDRPRPTTLSFHLAGLAIIISLAMFLCALSAGCIAPGEDVDGLFILFSFHHPTLKVQQQLAHCPNQNQPVESGLLIYI
jgi:hypothetical protein